MVWGCLIHRPPPILSLGRLVFTPQGDPMIQNSSSDLMALLEMPVTQHLFKKRIVVLSEGINGSVAKRTINQILALEADNATEPIWMFLNSPGGEVSSGFAIYDTMRFVQPDVKVVVTGLAASIATIILLGAAKQHRYSMPSSRLLIHQPLIGGNVTGQASDIEITAKEILRTRERIQELYHAETGQPKDRIARDIERDYWMSAQESVEYGLISRLVSSWKDVQ